MSDKTRPWFGIDFATTPDVTVVWSGPNTLPPDFDMAKVRASIDELLERLPPRRDPARELLDTLAKAPVAASIGAYLASPAVREAVDAYQAEEIRRMYRGDFGPITPRPSDRP